VTSINAQFYSQLRTRDYRTYTNDMRVGVSATGLYTYPDAVVVCGASQFMDGRRDTLLNPTLIVEVLSPSTEAYDRGRKFEHYQSVDSLQQYLLVASERVHADLFTRQPGGQWLLTSAGSVEDTIDLESIGCSVGLRESYERVEFLS
jgi:Uma2 family endonuclease